MKKLLILLFVAAGLYLAWIRFARRDAHLAPARETLRPRMPSAASTPSLVPQRLNDQG